MRQLEVKETMEKNELLMTYGTDYKEMTKRLLEEADLIGRIPGNDSLIGIKPNLVSGSDASWGATTHTEDVYKRQRLDLAARLGADAGINTKDPDFMDQVKELTGGRGFDYVYETAGNTITMKLAFQLAANKADICFIGTPTREMTFTVPEWENMNRKEFRLTGSWMSYSAPFPGKEWELAAYYFKSGDLKFDESFIYKKIPLSQIADAFEPVSYTHLRSCP